MKKKINPKDIMAIVALSDTAKVFLESLANRDKNRKVTTVDQVVSRYKVPRRDVIEMFKAMDEAGLGAFILGRRNQPSRFSWTTRMKDVGQAAIGETEEIDEIDEDEFVSTGDDISIEEDDDFLDCYDHPFKLRAGFEPITLSLPKDLTPQEADRIASFVKSLPITN